MKVYLLSVVIPDGDEAEFMALSRKARQVYVSGLVANRHKALVEQASPDALADAAVLAAKVAERTPRSGG
jgi:hypothetical protein